jgi:hypothetical protein
MNDGTFNLTESTESSQFLKRSHEQMQNECLAQACAAAPDFSDNNEPLLKRGRWDSNTNIQNDYFTMPTHSQTVPADVFIQIFGYLSFATIQCVIRLVCKDWNSYASSPMLYTTWSSSYVMPPPIQTTTLMNHPDEGWSSIFPAYNVNSSKSFTFQRIHHPRIKRTKRCTRLSAYRNHSSRPSVDDLILMHKVGKGQPFFTNLVKLSLQSCSWRGIKGILESTRDTNGVETVTTSLTHIHLSNCFQLTDEAVSLLISSSPSVESLRIISCPMLTGIFALIVSHAF